MKKACTLFLVIIAAMGCAKKFKESENNETTRGPASIEQFLTLSSKSGEQSFLTITDERTLTIPALIEVTEGIAAGQKTRLYIDYSSETSTYAYFCDYLPQDSNNIFEFSGCYLDESNEAIGEAMTYEAGDIDYIYRNNSIILEVVNSENLQAIEVRVQVDFID